MLRACAALAGICVRARCGDALCVCYYMVIGRIVPLLSEAVISGNGYAERARRQAGGDSSSPLYFHMHTLKQFSSSLLQPCRPQNCHLMSYRAAHIANTEKSGRRLFPPAVERFILLFDNDQLFAHIFWYTPHGRLLKFHKSFFKM
jgi:hypothetical protein